MNCKLTKSVEEDTAPGLAEFMDARERLAGLRD